MKRPDRAWTTGLLVAVTLLAGAAYVAPRWAPYRWLHGDGSFYYNVSRGLLEEGTLKQGNIHPRSWYERDMGWNRNLDAAWSNVALGRDGETWWPKHPWLLPLVATPFVWAAGPWGAFLMNGLLLLAVSLLAWRVARRLAPPGAALAAALLFAVSGALTEQAWSFSNDLFYTALALAAFDAGLARRPFAAGLLLGLSVVAKLTLVLLVPALLLVPVLDRDLRATVRMVAGLAGPAIVLMAANAWMFGSPFVTGYQRILVMEGGRAILHDHGGDFRWDRLGPALVGALRALWLAFPAWPLAAVGLGLLLARRRWVPAVALGLPIAVIVLFHAPYAWFRVAFGLPALAFSVPLLAVAVGPAFASETAPLPHPGRRWAWAAAALVGLLVLVGGVRRLAAGPPDSLGERIRQARVHLGEDPCDYFNNQVHAWECAGQDRGRAEWMTGPTVHPALRIEGVPGRLVRLSPHPSGRPRRVTWPLPADAVALDLVYGQPKDARGRVRFRVRAGGEVLLETRAGAGAVHARLPLPAGADSVTFEVEGRRPAPFGFEGRLERRPEGD